MNHRSFHEVSNSSQIKPTPTSSKKELCTFTSKTSAQSTHYNIIAILLKVLSNQTPMWLDLRTPFSSLVALTPPKQEYPFTTQHQQCPTTQHHGQRLSLLEILIIAWLFTHKCPPTHPIPCNILSHRKNNICTCIQLSLQAWFLTQTVYFFLRNSLAKPYQKKYIFLTRWIKNSQVFNPPLKFLGLRSKRPGCSQIKERWALGLHTVRFRLNLSGTAVKTSYLLRWS